MNWIIGTATGISLVILVIALYCALVIAGSSDKVVNKPKVEVRDNLLRGKQICQRCKTGKYTFELDRHSEACPYIGYREKDKCLFFVPLDKAPKREAMVNLKAGETSKNKNLSDF